MMSLHSTHSFRWNRLLLVVCLFSLGWSAVLPRPAQAGSKGQQLQFSVDGGGTFTYLRVEGKNQNDKNTVWEKTFSGPVTSWIIEKWWWYGTLLISADVVGTGRVVCVVDYVPEAQGGDYFPVKFYGKGSGCSSAGSAGSVGGIFDRRRIASLLESYILAKSNYSDSADVISLAQRRLNLAQTDLSKLSQDQIRGLLMKQTGADVKTLLERIISPECLFAISLALPEKDGLPLTRKTAEACKLQLDTVNALLSAWKVKQVPVR